MPMMSPLEEKMWERPPRKRLAAMPDVEIDQKYSVKQERIVTESNREKLPNFVKALERPGYMNVRPFYQRRHRWDAKRQSRLIESFIINIPVPPLFVYETNYNTYEVMDGQQRINAIRAFYSNEYELEGLERWPELNGKSYSKLPPKIKAGIDRRSISYVIVLAESAENEEDQMLLKQLVFERLNTGGVRLSHQEVRNSLFQGPFNSMLLELAKNNKFRTAWGLPPYSPVEETNPAELLMNNTFYKEMADVEVILRFFALRHVEHYQGGMRGFLDLYMARARQFGQSDLDFLKKLFTNSVDLAVDIYKERSFRPYLVKKKTWAKKPHKAFADAVMVGISRHLDRASSLRERSEKIVAKTKELFESNPAGTFMGQKNTKADVQGRIDLYSQMLESV